jgi:hypothetical protein
MTAMLDMENHSAKARDAEPTPEPAVPAILAAFDKYEVVGMSASHGLKDLDDFILSMIRTPAFVDKVNDIAVECGNSLYQPELDRYIAGEDIPFTSVRKVWRNTTQPMCGLCGFYELFFPLMRAINQKLPSERRLRVLACDPPIDWEQAADPEPGKLDRNASIASVLEKEVLSKHRKALMLFGISHIAHGWGAASIYEKNYPNVSFVVSNLGAFDTELPNLSAPACSPRRCGSSASRCSGPRADAGAAMSGQNRCQTTKARCLCASAFFHRRRANSLSECTADHDVIRPIIEPPVPM